MGFAIAGIVIAVIAIAGGILLANRNVPAQRQTKILLFAMYFWLLTFAQLIIFAIGYAVLVRT